MEYTTGTLYQWNRAHAYGFIRSTDERSGVYTDYFLHNAQIKSGHPEINSKVEFYVGSLVTGKNVLPAIAAVITPSETSFTAVR